MGGREGGSGVKVDGSEESERTGRKERKIEGDEEREGEGGGRN